MKFEAIKEVFAKIEKILNDDTMFPKPTSAWEALVHYKYQILTRYVPGVSSETDWTKMVDLQIEYLKEFISTSIRFGLGIPPLNAEGSLISIAAYNAAINKSNVEEGVFNTPSSSEIRQEFYRLLMEKDI